jgi:hypothetical protein
MLWKIMYSVIIVFANVNLILLYRMTDYVL